MKKIVALMGVVMLAAGCSGAVDGDAKTDTTTMPVDPYVNQNKEVNHTNENYGVTPADSSKIDSVPTGNAANGINGSTQGGGGAGDGQRH